jgi:hypothetical protein
MTCRSRSRPGGNAQEAIFVNDGNVPVRVLAEAR